ncbi:MAG: YcjF family protein [Lachnospiraceae bacterium]
MEEKNFFEEFVKKFKQEMKEMGHANLIIAGKTGVGKSTLINAAFREDIAKTGIGTPVTEEGSVKWYEKKDFPLRIYDTIGLELDEEKRNRSLEMIKKVCQDSKKSNDPDRFIHAMWYCVASDCDRLEQYEADYINSVSEEVDVVLVITKSYRKKHSERLVRAIEKDYPDLKVKNKVIVLAQSENPEDCDEDEIPKKAFGVDTLVEVTAQIVPESAQKAWCNAQKASVELKCEKAQTLVVTTAVASFGEGYIPLPFSDALALVPTQLAMLAGITAIFGITVSENLLKSIVTSLAGTAGATFAGRTIVSNLLKMVPGVGTAVGGSISGATASILTTALGESYIAIMKMIANGEINENALETKAVQEKLQNIFKDKLRKK